MEGDVDQGIGEDNFGVHIGSKRDLISCFIGNNITTYEDRTNY